MDWLEKILFAKRELQYDYQEIIGFMVYYNFLFCVTFYFNKNWVGFLSYLNLSFHNLLSEIFFEQQVYVYLLDIYGDFKKLSWEEQKRVELVYDFFSHYFEERSYKFIFFREKMDDFLSSSFLTGENYSHLVYETVTEQEISYVRSLLLEGI